MRNILTPKMWNWSNGPAHWPIEKTRSKSKY